MTTISFGIDRRLACTVRDCGHGFSNRWAFQCARSLSDLLHAQQRGWPVEEHCSARQIADWLHYVDDSIPEFTSHWTKNRAQLDTLLRHATTLEYEELLLCVGLRSGLESVARFLDPAARDELRDRIDPALDEVLRSNRATASLLQSRGSYDIDSSLEERWWWRPLGEKAHAAR
jgi:hypothetical protein